MIPSLGLTWNLLEVPKNLDDRDIQEAGRDSSRVWLLCARKVSIIMDIRCFTVMGVAMILEGFRILCCCL